MDPLFEILQDVRRHALRRTPSPPMFFHEYPPELVALLVERCPRLHPYVAGPGVIDGFTDVLEEELVNAIGPVVQAGAEP